MGARNTRDGYGWISRLIHWTMAAAVPAMFGYGLWMRSLDYYDPLYKSAPALHKSVGLVLLAVLAVRFGWRLANPDPDRSELRPLERRAAELLHWGFYPLLLALMASGYFISTADGRPIMVFGLLAVPAVVKVPGLEEIAGDVHAALAWLTIGFAALHAAAALKHHFLDRDRTLRKMLRPGDR